MEAFVYNVRCRVIICKTCGFACVSDEVPIHLRNDTERCQVDKEKLS
jgi:hypothetical protein